VLGGGGREHALAWGLARSPHVDEVVCAPGNPGMASIGECMPVSVTDAAAVVDLAAKLEPDLVVVGPEDPLVAGIVDALEAAGWLAFGPGAAAARLEGSKAWMKDVLVAAGVPTARYATFRAGQEADAFAFLDTLPGRYVVKTDGLAAGKGVVVTESIVEARDAVQSYLTGVAFGDAGRTCVIEEGLTGPEVTLFALCDGRRAEVVATAQDHKRAFDGDTGPNTGGMGAYSPAPVVTPEVHHRVMREVITPTVKGMAAEGIAYTGFLYAGLMVDAAGNPRVVEFNCRLGDPETQPMMMRMKSDLLKLVDAAIDGTLDHVEAEWDRRVALGVVVAAAGYPDTPRQGDAIAGLPRNEEDFHIFHAGTARKDGHVVTSGGRVLCVTALGEKVKMAAERAYEVVQKIRFEGMQYRHDIGHRAFQRRA
jgi:phosphoribosylamine--glycine ligase